MAASQYIPYVVKTTGYNFRDITGQRFHRLLVIEPLRRISPPADHAFWRCVCDCGKEVIAAASDLLKDGGTKSCGCFAAERSSRDKRTHGMTHTKTYKAWRSMRGRCTNPRLENYKDYGARGISVCERWSTFEAFFADMGTAPPGSQLDRVDVNGNYEPSNCRWTTPKVNNNNKPSNVYVEYKGQRMTLMQLSELTGVAYHLMYQRLRKHGYSVEEAVATPSRLRSALTSRLS